MNFYLFATFITGICKLEKNLKLSREDCFETNQTQARVGYNVNIR